MRIVSYLVYLFLVLSIGMVILPSAGVSPRTWQYWIIVLGVAIAYVCGMFHRVV